jgi:glycosyltransferase involved in cell wall biosynthesis
MTQDEIAKVYESCDVTISASKKVEGFSLHPLESMASGTPVITTDCGGVIDYAINESNSLVVPAEDSKAIRKSVDLLLENKALYNKLVKQGIKTSRQWLWFNQIDKLEKLFYESYYKAIKEETESLSICMIVKNEEKHLEQCLASIKSIASEIIIVDTGSTDGTIQIAKKFGARIFHYEWNDDFAAARNFALDKVTQAWTFILDADEKIAEKDILKIRQLLKEKKVYNVETRNYIDDKEVERVIVCNNAYEEDKGHFGWCSSAKIRLFPSDKRIRFKGKVHELVEESIISLGLEVVNAQFQVLHFGYLKSKKVKDVKDNIYVKLGKEKLKENENDIKAIFELAVQYTALNNYDEALILWRKALQLDPKNHEFLAKMGTTYNLLEDYVQAEKFFKQSLKLRESEYAYRHLGITYAKLNDYQKAYECFKKIVTVTKDLKAIGDYAFCCNYLKKFDESIMILEKILRFQKNLVVSWGLLEKAYNEKGIELAQNKKYPQAAEMFRSSLAVKPDFEPARRNLAEVLRVMQLKKS